MVRAYSVLLILLHAVAMHIALAGDDCPGEEAAGVIDPQHLLDQRDAGAQFYQRSVLATHGVKEWGAIALQSSANVSQEPKSSVTKVKPLDCEKEPRPLQSIKGENGFKITALDVTTGNYETKYEYPWDLVKGKYADMNACDVNPFDNIIYCVVRASGETYVCRLDDKTMEFVAVLPASVFSAAAFADTGEMFVSMAGAETIVLPPLHELQGYEDREDKKLKSYKSEKASKPEGFTAISDSVVVKKELKGGIGEQYFMVLHGPFLQIAAYEEGKCKKTWIKDIIPARWDNIYGAGWNFQGRVFFSTNRGAGVYAIPLDAIDLEDEEQKVELMQVGQSDQTDFNDGMNCKNIPNPWAYTGVPLETGGTLPPTAKKVATKIAGADPETVGADPETVGDSDNPLNAPGAAAPGAPGSQASPAMAAPPPEFQPKPPPPPGTGLFAFLIFLVIPCILCCLRHAQKNQSDFMPTPYAHPVRLPPTPEFSSERVVAAPVLPSAVITEGSPSRVLEPARRIDLEPPMRSAPAVMRTASPSYAQPPSRSAPAVILTESSARPLSPARPQATPVALATAKPVKAQVIEAGAEVTFAGIPQASVFTAPAVATAPAMMTAAAPAVLEQPFQTQQRITVSQTAISEMPPVDQKLGSSFGTVTTTSEVPVVEFAPTIASRAPPQDGLLSVLAARGSMAMGPQPSDASFGTITSEVPVVEFMPSPRSQRPGVYEVPTSTPTGISPVSSTLAETIIQ